MSNSPQRWELPSVNGPIVNTRRQEDEKREEVERSNREAMVTRGYEDGLAKAQVEITARLAQLDARIKHLDSVLGFLAKPLEALDIEVEKQLSTLAMTVGKQLARRELKTDPAQIIAIIREAVSRLPAAIRDIRVHLHPDDAQIVKEKLSTPGNERAWTIVEDPALTQGGCLVRTDNSQIDARLESRLNAIVSSILGDERSSARAAAIAADPLPEDAEPGSRRPAALAAPSDKPSADRAPQSVEATLVEPPIEVEAHLVGSPEPSTTTNPESHS
jgi:flagellar assembly protein FliH